MLIGGDVTDVRPPSTSFDAAVSPAAGPVTIPYRPDVTPPACLRPAAVEVGWGAPRAHKPLVAVSVPSALRLQPRLTSKSSSNAPQRAIFVADPSTANGQEATSMRYRTACLFRPVSDGMSESSG